MAERGKVRVELNTGQLADAAEGLPYGRGYVNDLHRLVVHVRTCLSVCLSLISLTHSRARALSNSLSLCIVSLFVIPGYLSPLS